MINFIEVGREPQMKALRLVLTLKWGLDVNSIVYAYYKKTKLAPLLPNTLYKWQQSFLFIRVEVLS